MTMILSHLCTAQSDTIYWNDQYHLQWKDYRGKPNPSSSAVAFTAYDIVCKILKSQNEKQLIVEVSSIFLPDHSWHKNFFDSVLLEHEHLHFAIVELFARHLRMIITQKTYQSPLHLKKTLEKKYRHIMKKMDKYQDIYDTETNYSMNIIKQKQWKEKITSELNQLSQYSSRFMEIPLANE